jgi:hypothetical protein
MKMPRFSIAWVMTVIVIAAVDSAAFPWLLMTNSVICWLLILGSIPMASILMFGIPSMARGFFGRGGIQPFLVGFERVGWTILLIYTGGAILLPQSVSKTTDLFSEFILKSVLRLDAYDTLYNLVSTILILLLPQLVAALIGGWLNQRLESRTSIAVDGGLVAR